MNKIYTLAALLVINFTAKAQTIPIESKDNALVLQVTSDKHLDMVYFGNKLSEKNEYSQITKTYHLDKNTDEYNSAYITSGTRNLLEPALSVTHADGNQSLDLQYISHTVTKINDDVSLISIKLKDSVYDFEVTL